MVRTTWLAVLLGLVAGLAGVPAYGGESVVPPPSGASFDYQLGGDRSVPDHVGIVVRDRAGEPEPDLYNVCYVNGFQTQPDERRFWRRHWRLVLKQDRRPVRDAAWGEWLLDLRTPTKRRALARIVGRWVEGCARDGFDSVELDNLDSFTRSRHLLVRRHVLAYARLLIRRAHGAGLPVAQKNLAELDGTTIGFDFAIAEECGRWRECGRYAASYGDQVLAVEYRNRDFRRTCRQYGAAWSVVRRDRALTPRGLRRWC